MRSHIGFQKALSLVANWFSHAQSHRHHRRRLLQVVMAAEICEPRVLPATVTFNFEGTNATARRGALTHLSLSNSGLNLQITRPGSVFDLIANVGVQTKPTQFGARSLDPFANTSATPFVINFNKPVKAVMIDIGDYGQDANDLIVLSAYSEANLGGRLVNTNRVTLPTLPGDAFNSRMLSVSGDSIRSLRILGGTSAYPQSVFIDNIKVTYEERVLTPGVYVAARNLAGVAFVGTHQFLILVPQNPQNYRGQLADLGDGTLGFVMGAHNDHGRLRVRMFEPSDVQATRQLTNPHRYGTSFSPEFDRVVLLSQSVDSVISNLLRARDRYIYAENRLPIPYPSAPGQFGPNCLNSNSWAQSIVEYVVGPRRVREDFTGADTCHENRIASFYFV